MKQYIDKLTIEHFVHGVMVVFALASVGNVASYFIATNHNAVVAFSMAFALGTAVCTTAIMLTKIDMIKQRNRYVSVFAMVLCLVAVSGFVQSQNYMAHGLTLRASIAMGFGIVFAGECLTAIALSLYQSAERRRKLDEADQGLELKLAEVFAETLDRIDPNKSVQYYERHIHKILKMKADELVLKYIPEQSDDKTTPEPNEPTTKYAKSNSIADYSAESLPIANAKRSNDAQQRRENVLLYIEQNGHVRHGEIAKELNIKKGTLSGDLAALENEGLISRNGTIALVE